MVSGIENNAGATGDASSTWVRNFPRGGNSNLPLVFLLRESHVARAQLRSARVESQDGLSVARHLSRGEQAGSAEWLPCFSGKLVMWGIEMKKWTIHSGGRVLGFVFSIFILAPLA